MNIVHSNAFLRPVTFMGHERVCPCPCVGRLCGFRVFVVSIFTTFCDTKAVTSPYHARCNML